MTWRGVHHVASPVAITQDAVPACRDRLDRGIDGIDLVVARRLAAAAVEVILQHDPFGIRRQAFPGAIARAECRGRGEAIAVGGKISSVVA